MTGRRFWYLDQWGDRRNVHVMTPVAGNPRLVKVEHAKSGIEALVWVDALEPGWTHFQTGVSL